MRYETEKLEDASSDPPAHGRAWVLVDLGIASALTGFALSNRRHGLPTDGLWFDDSWVAAGAIEGSLGNLMTVGSGHPSFTAFLLGWTAVAGDGLRALAYPALAFGTIGPAVLYLALRRFGYGVGVCGALGAALVASDAFVLYSGRVKGYVIDPVLILGILLLLPRLARARWRWPTAATWCLSAVVLGGFSGYLLLVTAGAGLLLVLHAHDDRPVRVAGVGAQAAAQLTMLVWAQRSTDLAEIEASQERNYDGHLDFSANPIRLGREIHLHARRVVDIFPGGSGPWLSILFAGAVLGLVIAAWSRRPSEAMRAQLGLLVLMAALTGGFLGRFPFGTTNEVPTSLGGRHSMWLMPVLAVGLAALVHRLVSGRPRAVRLAVDVALVAVAVLVVVRGASEPRVAYPFPGSELASEHIEDELAPGDVVLVTQTSIYAFLIATDLPADLKPTPDRMIGFTPVFEDRRIRTMGTFGEVLLRPDQVEPLVEGADRVLVQVAIGPFGAAGRLEGELRRLGFVQADVRTFDASAVVVWERGRASA